MNFINTFKRPLARLVLAGFAISLLAGCFPNKLSVCSKKSRIYIEKTLKPTLRKFSKPIAFGSFCVGGCAAWLGVCLYSIYSIPVTISVAVAAPFVILALPFLTAGGYCTYQLYKDAQNKYEPVPTQSPEQEHNSDR